MTAMTDLPVKYLHAEVERLRQELQDIADGGIREHDTGFHQLPCDGCADKVRWAREALERTAKDGMLDDLQAEEDAYLLDDRQP